MTGAWYPTICCWDVEEGWFPGADKLQADGKFSYEVTHYRDQTFETEDEAAAVARATVNDDDLPNDDLWIET